MNKVIRMQFPNPDKVQENEDIENINNFQTFTEEIEDFEVNTEEPEKGVKDSH